MEDRRKFQRVPFVSESHISCGDQSWSGELLDISLRGALFELPESAILERSANCYLDIVLADGNIHLQFESELAHQEGNQFGFRFLSEDLDTLTHLRRLLELNLGEDEIMKKEFAYWLGE